MNETLLRDQNHVPVLGAVTDDVAQLIRMLRVDPATGRLLVSAVIPGTTDGQIKVSSADTTFGYLSDKLVAGTNITLTINNPGADETITIDATGGSGGTPAGPDGAFQFNDAGAFGGSSDYGRDPSTGLIHFQAQFTPDVSGGYFQAISTDIAGSFMISGNAALNSQSFMGTIYDNGFTEEPATFMGYNSDALQIAASIQVGNNSGTPQVSIGTSTNTDGSQFFLQPQLAGLGVAGLFRMAYPNGDSQVLEASTLDLHFKAGDVSNGAQGNATLFVLEDGSGLVYVKTRTSFTIRDENDNLLAFFQNDGGDNRIRLGDPSGVWNNVMLDISQTNNQIKGTTPDFIIEDLSHNQWLHVNTGGQIVRFGDNDEAFKQNWFQVSDPDQQTIGHGWEYNTITQDPDPATFTGTGNDNLQVNVSGFFGTGTHTMSVICTTDNNDTIGLTVDMPGMINVGDTVTNGVYTFTINDMWQIGNVYWVWNFSFSAGSYADLVGGDPVTGSGGSSWTGSVFNTITVDLFDVFYDGVAQMQNYPLYFGGSVNGIVMDFPTTTDHDLADEWDWSVIQSMEYGNWLDSQGSIANSRTLYLGDTENKGFHTKLVLSDLNRYASLQGTNGDVRSFIGIDPGFAPYNIPAVGGRYVDTNTNVLAYFLAGDATSVGGQPQTFAAGATDTNSQITANISGDIINGMSMAWNDPANGTSSNVSATNTDASIGYIDGNTGNQFGLGVSTNGLEFRTGSGLIGTFVIADGSAGDVWTTDGAGHWSFQPAGSGGTVGLGEVAFGDPSTGAVVSDQNFLYNPNGGTPLLQVGGLVTGNNTQWVLDDNTMQFTAQFDGRFTFNKSSAQELLLIDAANSHTKITVSDGLTQTYLDLNADNLFLYTSDIGANYEHFLVADSGSIGMTSRDNTGVASGIGLNPTSVTLDWSGSGGTDHQLLTMDVVSTRIKTTTFFSVEDKVGVSVFRADSNALYTDQKAATVSSGMQVYTAGGSVTISGGKRGIYYDPASTVGSATITLPASPIDGQEVMICFGGTITSGTVITVFTLAPNSGQSVVGVLPATATANSVYEYKWRSSVSKWYQLR